MRSIWKYWLTLAAGSTLFGEVAPATALAAPAAGSHELSFRLTVLPVAAAIDTFDDHNDEHARSDGKMDAYRLGYGKYLTDHIQLGLAVSVLRATRPNGAGAVKGLGVEPFLQVFRAVSTWAGVYGIGAVGYLVGNPGNREINPDVWTVGTEAGVSLFTDRILCLRLGPAYQYVHMSGTKGGEIVSVHALSLNGTLAVYF